MPRTVRFRTTLAPLVLIIGLACNSSPYREVQVDLGAAGATPAKHGSAIPVRRLRISVAAMLSPRNTFQAYSALFARVGDALGIEVDLVQRTTYAEVNELLLSGGLDAALVCTGGYLELKRQAHGTVEILAVPVIDAKTTYESFVIVPTAGPATSLADLRGKRFAFTDPLSLSGRAYVVASLRRVHEGADAFFAETTFTRSHDRSIEAVASGLVDGASVDSLVFASTARQNPDLVARTRVIDRSPPLGMMPVVAAPSLAPDLCRRLRNALLGLHQDPAAVASLRAAHIERFVRPAPDLYDAAAVIIEAAR